MIAEFAVQGAFGVAAFLGGVWAGKGRRTRDKPVEAICGCKHHLSNHEKLPGGYGACHYIEYVCTGEDPKKGYRDVYEPHPCSCRHYVGALPADQFFGMPMLPPSEQ